MRKIPKFLISMEVFSVLGWLAGLFTTGNTKAFFWAFPAGFAVGMIIPRWIMAWRKRNTITNTAMFDSRTVSPEIKAEMDKLMEMLKESGDLEDKKCDDPHCEGCWGLGGK